MSFGKTRGVSDAEQREHERRAPVDPDAALAAGLGARRAGLASEALDWFERAWLAGQASAASAFVELVQSVSPEERARHVPRLDSMEQSGVRQAGVLWHRWFPAVARLAGPSDPSRPLLDFVFQQALSTRPIRLAGTCDGSQELVARALVELSGRRTLHTKAEGDVCPTEEHHGLEHVYGVRPFDALFLYGQSESHYGRLLERLLSFCSSHGVRVILGVRRDAWDGDRFAPFTEGAELEVPPLRWTVPTVDVPRWLEELLREIGGLELGRCPVGALRALERVDWTPLRLFHVARRCCLNVARGADLEQCLVETVDWHATHPGVPPESRAER
jgi:hypothetical protein